MTHDQILAKQFVMTDGGRVDKIGDLYTTYNPLVDLEAMKEGGYIDAVDRMMEPITMSLDDHSPEVIAYWAKQGMVKEFHGANNPMSWTEYEKDTGYHWRDTEKQAPQNAFKKWNSFVPVSAFRPENKDKKYPVVIMLHGGFNPISVIDGWGVPQEAAKREWIVIAPSLELDDVLDEILQEAKELYPIDESRIYVCGFSYGGFMSNFLGNKRPDVYAAVCPCGAPLSNGFVDKAIGPEPQTPFDGVPRALAMNTYMPVMNIAGNLDGCRFPLFSVGENNNSPVRATKEGLIEGFNSWLKVNKAKEMSLEEVEALGRKVKAVYPDKKPSDCYASGEGFTEEEANLGFPLEEGCGEKVVADGITNYIGSFPSEDGIVRTKVMVEMNMPHWPTPEMARQMFDFFSHFKRDRQTGESIYVE